MYFPDATRVAAGASRAAAGGRGDAHQRDGEKLIAWFVPPRGDKPLVLYFQGNAEGLPARVGRFTWLTADGTGLLALCYRGYGGSTGTPTEDGLIRDAVAAYDFARARYPAERIVLFGESLGTAVAVALAAGHEIGGAHPRCAVHLRRRGGRRRLSVRAGALADEGQVPLRRAHRPRVGAALGAARRAGPHRADPLRRNSCSRWRASPSALCASRKAAMSISTTTAPPKW